MPVARTVTMPTKQLMWAFEQSAGAATKTATGEFVDRPVAERARQILGL